MQQTQISCLRKNYQKIQLQTRKRLIELIIDQGKTITDASRALGINPSTGKMIFKKYRETGQFYEKKEQKLKRMIKQSLQSSRQLKQQFPQYYINLVWNPYEPIFNCPNSYHVQYPYMPFNYN